MTVLAYGAKNVSSLEEALGGKPPRKTEQQALAALEGHARERFERRKSYTDVMRPLLEQAQAPILELAKADKAAAQSLEKRRDLVLASRKQKLRAKHRAFDIEPRVMTGSTIWLKVPPYDVPFQSANGAAGASSDINTVKYSLGASGNGSSAAASAGLGVWFWSTEDNPSQRIAAPFDYDYHWEDMSHFYTAHNDGSTNIWVFGHSENAWVLQQGSFDPTWSDGTGWLEDHGSGGEQSGTETLQAFFPARANSWYLAFVWSQGYCDDTSGNLFGFSFSQQEQSMSVPFLVFGSL